MKKLICLLLVLAAAVTMAACGEDSKPQDTAPVVTQGQNATQPADSVPETTEATREEPSGLSFQHKGVTVTMGALADPVITALGEPKSCTEEASCIFEGLDKTYFYGSFYVQTSPSAEGDKIMALWLVDDTVATPEGLYIGCTEQQVQDAYGDSATQEGSAYRVAAADTLLTIVLTDGTVSSIQYTYPM